MSERSGGDLKVFISRRASAAERSAELDDQTVARFAARVRELYPHGPQGREQRIVEHACRKYSGRARARHAKTALLRTW